MENTANTEAALLGKEKQKDEIEELLLKLPREKSWDGLCLYHYQGFWFSSRVIHGFISFQRQFQAKDSDIILASFPKSGTTWLRALTFSIVNRSSYALKDSPLLTTSPHDLVPQLELLYYKEKKFPTDLEDKENENNLTPRILPTHAPYASLPQSILNSNCNIVYICRNPLDQFISHWHFLQKVLDQDNEMISLEEALHKMCNGVQPFGPIWEHMLGYWKASIELPHKILFLTYEDLKEDIHLYVKKLADFIGCAFSNEEGSQGVIEEISNLCSFDNLKNLEVNKSTDKLNIVKAQKSSFFRKGQVGDHTNYLSPSMFQRLEEVTYEKLGVSGLTFKKS